MDKVVAFLSLFPSNKNGGLSDKQYDERIRQFIGELNAVPEKELLKTMDDRTVLEFLDPSIHTAAHAFALQPQIKRYRTILQHLTPRDRQPLQNLVGAMCLFLETFDKYQIRYLGKQCREIIKALPLFAKALGEPAHAVKSIAAHLQRLDPSGSTLTSSHHLLCELALTCMAYEDVAAVAEKDILYLPTKSFVDTPKYLRTSSIAPRQLLLADLGFTAVLTPFEIQEYFLYAATILTGLKRWSEAANLLENVIAYPTKGDVISQQMVQAYKKWVLVTALLRGRVGPIPELTRMRQAKTLRTIAKPYDILVGLFDSDDAARFEDEVHEGMRIWEEDVNLGLVQSIRESYRQHRVKNLGTVFKTIPLNRVSQFTSAKSADAHIDIEDIISEMISSGQLNASIVTSVSGGRYLRFNTVDEGKTLDEGTVGDQIAATLTKINGIKDDIKNADRFMTEQNDYLTHLKRFKNATKGGFSGDVVGLPLIGLDEEDLMSG